MGNIRLVTFQDSHVYQKLKNDGYISTVLNGMNDVPARYSRCKEALQFYLVDNKEIVTVTDDLSVLNDAIACNLPINRIIPFYAYSKHNYGLSERRMSIYLLYKASSHFMGCMGFEGRDIIELDVPEEFVRYKRTTNGYDECILTEIKLEWVVSVLEFKKWVTELRHGENALLYKNTVLRTDTYHMCYSNDVVFNGHTHVDDVRYMLSPVLLENVTDTAIQRDYVQQDVFNTFTAYAYCIRHDLPMSAITRINMKAAYAEMPETLNKGLINSFNLCKDELFAKLGTIIYPSETTYKQRMSNKSFSNNPLLKAASMANQD